MGATKKLGFYQFKVTLRDISPPIWRRIQVWEDYTLAQLHRILQVVMGWENYHLYEFRIGRKMYRDPHPDNELGFMGTGVPSPCECARLSRPAKRVLSAVWHYSAHGDPWST